MVAVWLESQICDTMGQVGRIAQGISKALLAMDYDTVAQLATMAHCDMREVLHKVNPEASHLEELFDAKYLAVNFFGIITICHCPLTVNRWPLTVEH